MRSRTIATAATTILCLWPVAAASAFATRSAPMTNPSAISSSFGPMRRGDGPVGRRTESGLVGSDATSRSSGSQSRTSLSLSIPRGGAAAVSELMTTPSGAFNVALAVLAASTAVLKLGNRSDGDGGAEAVS